MSALPYQPVPTASQQRELERWVQRKYPVRQYRDNVDESIADFRVVQLRYEERQPEPALFCADVDEDEAPALFGMVDALRAEFGRAWPVYFGTYLILVALAVVLTLILTGVIHA